MEDNLSSKNDKQESVEKDHSSNSEDETKEEGLLFEEDDHDSMKSKTFEKYFASLCEKLPKNSVIVIDNASYHLRNSDSYPKANWRKQQLIDWLKKKNVTIPDKALRAELWTMAKVERETYSSKVVDEIAMRAGHTVIQLPPDNRELNPIELAWAAEKNFVAKENSGMKLDSVEKLLRKERNYLPREFWANCVEHVKKVEQSYRESDKIQDVQVEKLVIALKGNDSSDTDSETSLSAEESDDNLHDM